jgi:hypothetical protein
MPDGTTIESVKRSDGSATETATSSDGTVVVANQSSSGVKTTTTKDSAGNVTTTTEDTTIPPVVDPWAHIPSFADGQELIDTICRADPKFCPTPNAPFELETFCNFMHEINQDDRDRIMFKSSLTQLCWSDFEKTKVCTDESLSTNLCSDGKTLNRSWCAQYPDQCTSTSSTPSCASDIYDCLA